MKVNTQNINGEPTGNFIITNLKSNALLKKVGLRNNDIITRVNGQSPMNLTSILKDSSITEYTLEYIRAGRAQVLNFTVKD